MEYRDIVIVGGGPAGLAAALSARKKGIENILILERGEALGGILNQCIHNGFGLHTFKEELTGPEYASRYIEKVVDEKIEYSLNTMVVNISEDRVVTAMNSNKGIFEIKAGAIVLAMGCRERPRGALNIPGYRPAGIYSAGTAQHYVNIEGKMPGKEVVILGSGDIGLIMARRMTLEGAKVKAVLEVMPYSGGLQRNIVQCLDDYGIPLKLSHTVIDIEGKDRITGVAIAKVDENRRPVKGTEEHITCDTLLLSVGLIPENELSIDAGVELNPVTNGPVVDEELETSLEGVFACGNVLHVHDLVDFVSKEASQAGENAARYVNTKTAKIQEIMDDKDVAWLPHGVIDIVPVGGVRYTVPSRLNIDELSGDVTVRFRVGNVYENCNLIVKADDEELLNRSKKVMIPGKMEELVLKKDMLDKCSQVDRIEISVIGEE